MASNVEVLESFDLGYGFIPEEFLVENGDEYYFRNIQNGKDNNDYRHLTSDEIKILEEQLNKCKNWDDVLVSEPFNPHLISNTSFYGLVRIGKLDGRVLRFHDFAIEQGITNSRIISCDIQDYVAVHDVKYLSHYIVKSYSILHRIGEMQTTNHAKFGIGVIKEGESVDVRIDIGVRNENLGRKIYPFLSMTCADAMLYSTYRSDSILMEKLDEFTKDTLDNRRGYYGIVDEKSVLKECLIIKDVNFGKGCYVKGANKLKNLTIDSALDQATQIGEGVELVNGIINKGCHVFYGVKAVRFIMQDCSNLKYGARLINSVLGDNSTISCCEVLNNLVFPSHEQHHNNSFLISSLIMGQSNMAAGANIGSNHNSRANDGELIAGRGFWPSLSSSLKFNSRFASFTLIVQGNYPNEINLIFPFSMLSGNIRDDVRCVMPAYWWLYNMYALERNSYKTKKRDRRKYVRQVIESDYLAPDTVYEMIEARAYLERIVKSTANKDINSILLSDELPVLEVEGIENKKKVNLIKWKEGYRAYYDMLLYYSVSTLLESPYSIKELEAEKPKIEKFVNMGGQLIREERVFDLILKIREGEIRSWDEIHRFYQVEQSNYLKDKCKNAIAVLNYLYSVSRLSDVEIEDAKKKSQIIRAYIEEQIFITKDKDYKNEYRLITYNNTEERDVILGTLKENEFIEESRKKSLEFYEKLKAFKYS